MAKAAGEADRVSDRQPDDQKPSPFAVAPVPKRKPPPARPVPAPQPETVAAVAEPAPPATPPAPPPAAPTVTKSPTPKTTEVEAKPAAPLPNPLGPSLPRGTTGRHTGAHVTVEAEPVAGSRLGRAVARIPLLRRLKKQPQLFVPPKPLREVRPTLTEREAAWVVRPVPVDVKVYVGENGKVEYAELLSNGRRPELASVAVYAARRWTFAPARVGDETAPGEVILHFRFAPVE